MKECRLLEFVELIITSGTYKVCDSMPYCVIHKREFIMHSKIR